MKGADYIYFTILLAGALLAVIRFSKLDKADKLIAVLLMLTLPQEVVCLVLFLHGQNNYFLLRGYSLVEFLLTTGWFYLLFKQRLLRTLMGGLICIGLLWYIQSAVLMKPLLSGLSFLLFEALTIVLAALFYCLYVIFRQDEKDPFQTSAFWITLSLLFYWATTFTRSGLLLFPGVLSSQMELTLEKGFFFINLSFYVSLTIILFVYKRLSAHKTPPV